MPLPLEPKPLTPPIFSHPKYQIVHLLTNPKPLYPSPRAARRTRERALSFQLSGLGVFGFRVWGLRFGDWRFVQGLRFEDLGLGCRGLGFRGWDFRGWVVGLQVSGFGFGFRGFRVSDWGLRVWSYFSGSSTTSFSASSSPASCSIPALTYFSSSLASCSGAEVFMEHDAN